MSMPYRALALSIYTDITVDRLTLTKATRAYLIESGWYVSSLLHYSMTHCAIGTQYYWTRHWHELTGLSKLKK